MAPLDFAPTAVVPVGHFDAPKKVKVVKVNAHINKVTAEQDLAFQQNSPALKLPPPAPEWEEPPLCAKPCETFLRICGLLLHPIVVCCQAVSLLVDLILVWRNKVRALNSSACLRQDWSFDTCYALSHGLFAYVSSLLLVFFGCYATAMKLMHHFDFTISAQILAWSPWPVGRSWKAQVLARLDRVPDVAWVTRMHCGKENHGRKAAVEMWVDMSAGERTAERRFDCMEKHVTEDGADINFPSMDGCSLLHYFAAQLETKHVRWLLDKNASPNVQDLKGNTPLHVAAVSIYNTPDIVFTLLRDSDTDPCIYNKKGLTPLMLRLHGKKPPEPLRPSVPWEVIEETLGQRPVEQRLAALAYLGDGRAPSVRLPDHLFCDLNGEVALEELVRRRKSIWELLLKPVTMEVCIEQDLSDDDKATLLYVWAATEGPPQLKHDARESYRSELQESFSDAMIAFSGELRTVHQSMTALPETSLLALPSFHALLPDQVNHGSFQGYPTWAISCDLSMAAKELECLRVVRDAACLCDLLQRGHLSCTATGLLPLNKARYDVFTGRKRLKASGTAGLGYDHIQGQTLDNVFSKVPTMSSLKPQDGSPSPMSVASTLTAVTTVKNSSTIKRHRKRLDPKLEFWIGFVTLWLLALHLYARPAFIRRLKEIALPSELLGREILPKPVKDFEAVMAWARHRIVDMGLTRWGDKVLAPLWATDILSCSFEATTVKRALEIEKGLAQRFPVISRENCFETDGDEETGQNRYHKFVLLMQTEFTTLGRVSVMVEVSVYLMAYAAVNKKADLVRHASSWKGAR